MFTKWTEHLNTDKEKEDFLKSLLSSTQVLERLTQILQDEEKSLDRSEVDIRTYETPAWAYKQAHKNGDRQRLLWLKKLIDLDQQKGTNDR